MEWGVVVNDGSVASCRVLLGCRMTEVQKRTLSRRWWPVEQNDMLYIGIDLAIKENPRL